MLGGYFDSFFGGVGMLLNRRHALALLFASVATNATATQSAYSLKGKAKWRSFGEEDWIFRDPFERAKPGAKRLPYSSWSISAGQSRTDQVLSLIGFAEAGKLQYNAVHMSAQRKPGKPPTHMTLNEILYWIRKTPGQQHAIGRYQFIPSTLVSLIKRGAISYDLQFNHRLQDHLAVMLLRDAGYEDFLAGRMKMSKFMDNLAWIWAGLPLRNGRSAYRGVAGNRATISRKFYATQMQRIFS